VSNPRLLLNFLFVPVSAAFPATRRCFHRWLFPPDFRTRPILDPCTAQLRLRDCCCLHWGRQCIDSEAPTSLSLLPATFFSTFMTHLPFPAVANHGFRALVSPFLSRRTLAPTALSVTPLSTSRLPLRPTVPSLSSLARRSLSARSLSSLLASPSRTRRLRVPPLRAVPRVLAAVTPPAVAVGLAVAVAVVPVVVATPV